MKEEIKEGELYGLCIENTNKRELKDGETDYPTYEFKDVSEIFDALTTENMERFFEDFASGLRAMVHMRELTLSIARGLADKDGVELPDIKNVITMPSFTWIDDRKTGK